MNREATQFRLWNFLCIHLARSTKPNRPNEKKKTETKFIGLLRPLCMRWDLCCLQPNSLVANGVSIDFACENRKKEEKKRNVVRNTRFALYPIHTCGCVCAVCMWLRVYVTIWSNERGVRDAGGVDVFKDDINLVRIV